MTAARRPRRHAPSRFTTPTSRLLDGAGAWLWHHQSPAYTFVTPDPCGAVLCAHDDGVGVTVNKLAP